MIAWLTELSVLALVCAWVAVASLLFIVGIANRQVVVLTIAAFMAIALLTTQVSKLVN